jgi:ubiquinone/menaquinone biosynthesis C-methylase UbiE
MPNIDNIEADSAQSAVNAYFRREASYWADIYERSDRSDIAGAIHQERLRAALAMVDSLRLPSAACALDVGCGAGLATVGLACRGLTVDALDPIQIMLDATRNRAIETGVVSRVTTQIGGVQAIPFPDESFDLVLALGVLPWLPQVEKPLREMFRVLRPGSSMIASVDTRWQLRQFLDPFLNPLLRGPRRLAAHVLGRPPRDVRCYVTSLRSFRRMLDTEGFEEIDGVALGFGPFTIFSHEVLPRAAGLNLNNWLQSMADRGTPILRSSGSQYLFLLRKRSGGSKG